MFKNKHKLAVVLAVWQALSFVLMGVWVRMMDGSFSTYQQTFWRFIAAAGLCWLLFGVKFKKETFREIRAKDWFVYVLRSFLNYGVGVVLFTTAVLHADLAQVSFVSALPIVGLLAWLMFKEKLDAQSLPFILLSVVGLVLITGITSSSLHLRLGTIAAIVSTLAFDIAYLMVRYHPKELSNFHNTTLMLSFAWIPPLALLLMSGQSIIPAHISDAAGIGLAASVSLNVTGLYILNFIFSNMKGYVAGNILLLEGVFALILGYIFYNETLSLLALVGAAVIVVCAVALSRINLRQEKSLEGEV